MGFQIFKGGKKPQMNNNSSMSTKTSMYASKTSMYKPMLAPGNGKKGEPVLTSEQAADLVQGAAKKEAEARKNLQKLENATKNKKRALTMDEQKNLADARKAVKSFAAAKDKGLNELSYDENVRAGEQEVTKDLVSRRLGEKGWPSPVIRGHGETMQKYVPGGKTATIENGEIVDKPTDRSGLGSELVQRGSFSSSRISRSAKKELKKRGHKGKVEAKKDLKG